MAKYTQTYTNVVVLGNMNPQILTHNWLVKERIISKKVFGSTEQRANPFTQFISTPPFVQLAYGNLLFTVEIGKFVLQQNEARIDNNIFKIAKRYFETLHHTPVQKIGFNVHGILQFDSRRDESLFDKRYLSCGESLKELTGNLKHKIGFEISYKQGRAFYGLQCSKVKTKAEANINCNWEFDVSSPANVTSVLESVAGNIRYMDKLNRSLITI